MPIHARWTDESQTVIYAQFEQHWTITQFAQTLQEIKGMVEQVDYPVYAIAVGKSSRLPRSGNLLPHLRYLFNIPLAYIVAVPSTSVATAVLSMMTQLNPDWHEKISFAKSPEEAWKIIEQKREIGD